MMLWWRDHTVTNKNVYMNENRVRAQEQLNNHYVELKSHNAQDPGT